MTWRVFRMGTGIGGERDGNPNVTADLELALARQSEPRCAILTRRTRSAPTVDSHMLRGAPGMKALPRARPPAIATRDEHYRSA